MSKGCKHIASILLLILCYCTVNAQVNIKAGVDRSKILIGEPILLSVEAYVPLGTDVVWFPSDTIPHFDILKKTSIDTAENMDGKKITQLITMTSFDSGQWVIPSFKVMVAGQPYYSDSLTIDVTYQPFDARQDYRDIKDIIEVANPYAAWAPLFIAIIVIICIAGLFFLLRKRRATPKIPEAVVQRSGAYEEAVRAIEELKKKGLKEGGEKEYYSSMNDILRTYISRKFNISTFERTNEELILQLSGMHLPRESFSSLSQALRMSDFVKFAKYRPAEDDNRNNLEIVRSSIDILNNHAVSAV